MITRMKIVNMSISRKMKIEARIRDKASQIQVVCFEVRATCFTSLPSLREGFHYPLRITIKVPQLQGLLKTQRHNSNSKSSTQEVALSQLRFTSSWQPQNAPRGG